MMRIAFSVAGLTTFIFILAATPLSITIIDGNLSMSIQTIIDLVKNYLSGLLDGNSFTYQEGKDRTHSILQDISAYFSTSLHYLLLAGFLSVVIGMLISAWYSKSKKEWIKDIIGFLGTIPDFILVIFLQLGVIFIYESTGLRIARVASRSADENGYLLPLITLTLIPAIYLIRTLSERTYDVLSEDYILTAKAKGLRKGFIHIHHVVRNVLPYLKADLHKVLAIMMSNLFIVEYLFNIRGLTAILFGGTLYQYNLVVNTLFSLVFLYLIIYWSIRLLILLLERVFAHD
jgi:peptide/nickel transport system permease protein